MKVARDFGELLLFVKYDFAGEKNSRFWMLARAEFWKPRRQMQNPWAAWLPLCLATKGPRAQMRMSRPSRPLRRAPGNVFPEMVSLQV
jgi:hypothetical protein